MDKESWGTYTPPDSSLFLRAIVKIGLARGMFSRWIRHQWSMRFPEVVDAEVRGIKYRLNITDNVTDAKLLLSSKYYDREELDALAVPNGKVFIDIGANTGYYSLNLAHRGFQKIIAIEANPPTVERLTFNVNVNNFSDKIHIVPLCVGKGGTVEFYSDGNLGAASLVRTKEEIEPILVESKPLYKIMQEANIKQVHSMKIDVEGYEDQVLIPFFEEAPKKLWPNVIVIEHCHSSIWQDDVLDYLLDGKYRLIKKMRSNSIIQKT